MIKASIILKSVSDNGIPITTFSLQYPRYIHAQLMTHRTFSRNVSSSRAIPITKMIDAVSEADVKPLRWGSNQSGMEAGDDISDDLVTKAEEVWNDARNNAIQSALELSKIGVHKQWTNRILEPFMLVNTIVTATDWSNFYNLRISEHAQDEINVLAEKMIWEDDSTDESYLRPGEWHLPYVMKVEEFLDLLSRQIISVARCARVSYTAIEGKEPSSWADDARLYTRLLENGHWSPFEHVAQAMASQDRVANFRGWIQLRKILDAGANN